jgi:hypothetical protein
LPLKIRFNDFSPHALVLLIIRLLYHAIDATRRGNELQGVLSQLSVALRRLAIDILPSFFDVIGQLIRGDPYDRAILTV